MFITVLKKFKNESYILTFRVDITLNSSFIQGIKATWQYKSQIQYSRSSLELNVDFQFILFGILLGNDRFLIFRLPLKLREYQSRLEFFIRLIKLGFLIVQCNLKGVKRDRRTPKRVIKDNSFNKREVSIITKYPFFLKGSQNSTKYVNFC